MKKYLMFALFLSAITSMAFGQLGVAGAAEVAINCPDDECHVAPFFMGEGGFIGEIADGFDEVNFVVDCGLVSTSATAEASGGVVAQLLSMDNGLACADGGTVEVHGLKDGGWYWVTDAMNSAVASLVAKDALGNDMVMPANPGGTDITLQSLKDGATSIVKQASTGRIGILHHVLPEPMMADLEPCAPYWDGDDRTYYPNEHECALGDGGTEIVMWLPSDNRGRGAVVEGVVHRPANAANSPLEIELQLWGNGSGHIAPGMGAAALRGWNISTPSSRPQPAPFDANFGVVALSGTSFDAAQAGISISSGDTGSRLTMEPVAAVDHDATTVWLDSGHTDADGTADCQQDYREGQGIGIADQIAFVGSATGNPTLWIPSDNASGGVTIGTAASDGDVTTWVDAWNGAAAADEQIEVLDFDHDDADGDGDVTTGTENTPMVVCQMEEVESTVAVSAILEITNSTGPTSYCGSGRNLSADVLIYANSGDARAFNDDIVPLLSRSWVPGLGWQAATTTLRVMCP